jgi:hypothetical protein
MSKKLKKKKSSLESVVASEASLVDRCQADEFDWRAFDPLMLKGGLNAPLATELVTYRDRLDELLLHEGRYVVIKGRVIAGFFDDRESAVEAVIAQYGPGPILIKKVVEREPVRRIGQAIL